MITKVKQTTLDVLNTLGYLPITDPSIGCIGDGVFDNTPKFTTALTLGIPLFIPSGIFLLTAVTIPSGCVLFGSGDKSVLKLKMGANTSFLTASGTCNFSNFKIDANKVGQIGSNLHGLIITNSIGTELYNLNITNALADCININGSSTNGISLIDCKVSGFTKNGCTVEAGSDIRINNLEAFSSDVLASPGDGISLAPIGAGSSITSVSVINCGSKNNVGRGISCVGFGGKNVQDVTITGNRCINNTSHGLHLFTVQGITVGNNIIKSNAGDGIRLEGDTQLCRVTSNICDSNTGFGAREVTTGSTPDFNGLIYNALIGNGNNTQTKLGASSFVV